MNKSHIYIRILEFWSNRNTWFSHSELINTIKPNGWESGLINIHIQNALANGQPVRFSIMHPESTSVPPNQPSIFIVSERIKNNEKFILNHEAFMNYIDFLEIEQAIKTWNEAKIIAIISIMIAILTWAFQISKDSILLNWITNFF